MPNLTTRRTALLFAACFSVTAIGLAAPARADGIAVDHAWARASAGGATTGAAYFTLTGGAQPDTLVGVSTPAASKAELHETLVENGITKMRAAASLAIPAGKVVSFAPGGYHVMLTGLKQPLAAEQSFPLTLTFAHAAPVTVDVHVQGLGHATPMEGHDHMHMQ
nr:copper chaperone PCu(A)C [uncultured Rhodopila sp.]